MSDRPDSTDTADNADEPRYRHSKRPEWGEAVVVERRADRCVLRFEDGVERTIGKRFYHLVHLVADPSEDEGLSLEPPVEPQEAPPASAAQDGDQQPATMDFAAQLQVFRALHPAGFEDASYRDRYRVRREGDRSKRQVDPLLAAAAFQLGRPAFDRPRAKRSPADVHKAVIDLLDTTSLVAASDVAGPLGEFNRRRLSTFATALRNLLFGMQSFEVRLERWVEVLHHGGLKHVSWPTVTLLPALVHPREQQFVRPVLLQRLGSNLGQGDHLFRKPSPEGYAWYAKVSAVAQAELTVAGLEPHDLFDVLFFASITLGKEGVQAWERIREGS